MATDTHDGSTGSTCSPLHAATDNPGKIARSARRSQGGDEVVLADLQHDLGNLFHKLYYWAEYLRDAEAARNGDAAPGEMLEGTIRQLQEFLKVAFEYLSPIELRPTAMAADDVLDCFARNLSTRLCGAHVEVRRDGATPGMGIAVDPARISQALEIAVRHVAALVGEESLVELVAAPTAVGECPGIELKVLVERPVGESAFFKTAEGGVEWALAEKVFRLHGGVLSHRAEGEGQGIVIKLPATGAAEDVSVATDRRCD